CPACGKRVVAEPKRNDTPPPLTREQIDDACSAFKRAWYRTYLMIHVAFLIFLASPFFVLGAYRDAIKGAVQPVMDPYWIFMLLLFGPVLLVFIVGLMIEHWAGRALRCPHCDGSCCASKPHVPNLTQLTGNCEYCGRKLVNELPPEEPLESLPTADEFKAAESRTPVVDRLGWLLGVLMVALMMVVTGYFVAYAGLDPVGRWKTFEQRHGGVIAAILMTALIAGYCYSGIALVIVTARLLAYRHKKRREAEPVLNCPHCHEELSPGRHVVASQRCPACRKRVLANPNTEPVASEVTES
ncbi:MAG: hypothetical protein L0241_28895, partial [Planctomycetia bacterium]|nr:hypothetical protein [Planctomycetia bacterium]